MLTDPPVPDWALPVTIVIEPELPRVVAPVRANMIPLAPLSAANAVCSENAPLLVTSPCPVEILIDPPLLTCPSPLLKWILPDACASPVPAKILTLPDVPLVENPVDTCSEPELPL